MCKLSGYFRAGCIYSHGQSEMAIFCHAWFYSISKKNLLAMIPEKAAGSALLLAIAFLFSLRFPFGPTRLFLPHSRRDVRVRSLVKDFRSCRTGSGDGWSWQGSTTSHVEQQQLQVAHRNNVWHRWRCLSLCPSGWGWFHPGRQSGNQKDTLDLIQRQPVDLLRWMIWCERGIKEQMSKGLQGWPQGSSARDGNTGETLCLSLSAVILGSQRRWRKGSGLALS